MVYGDSTTSAAAEACSQGNVNSPEHASLLAASSPPAPSSIWRALHAQLLAELTHVPLELLLPKDVDDLAAAGAVAQRPGKIYGEEAAPLLRLERRGGEDAQPRHGEERIRKLKGLERYLALADDGQARDGVVEVVALAVALHDVGALLVVDVAHGGARVGRDALAVEPADVGAADGVGGKRAQGGQGERLGGDARAEAQDAAAGRVGEHGVAQA
ncbi:hypothetical protein TCAP_05643, partial [Tolypocladium capitatum]